MSRFAPFRTRRTRIRLTWLALVVLLFQQIALAAYACPITATASATMASAPAMADCDDMAALDPEAPALCLQHCQRDNVASPDAKVPQIPPLALPPLQFAWIAAALPPPADQFYEDVPACRSDPPPARRFCSLQI